MTMNFAHKASAALMLAALGLGAAHPALAQTAYTFTTLDDPLAGVYTTANGSISGTLASGINASGEIVGYYYDSAGTHGFTETPGGGYGDGTNSYGFVYTPGAGFQTIIDPSATGTGSSTFASGISDAGQIIGNYSVSTDFNQHGFIDTPEAGGTSFFAGLADPSTTGSTIAKGINTSGEVVGYTSSKGVQTSFLLPPGAGFTDFVDPAAPKHTLASGINDLGQIAGSYFSTTSGSTKEHGFVETPGAGGLTSTFVTLDDPAAPSGISVEGINNEGQVVGFYRDANSVYHGFLATPAAVPEASSVVSFGFLLLLGAGGLWSLSRRRTKSAA